MVDGIYSIRFRGAADWGMGMLILKQGLVIGSDTGGILYDGTFSEMGDQIQIDVLMTIPPGGTLVQGTQPRPTAYTIRIKDTLSKAAILTAEPILLQLEPGPVNIIFQCLRPLES